MRSPNEREDILMMKVRVEKPQKSKFLIPVLAVLLIGGFVFFIPRLSSKPSTPLAYEVVGYEGNVQVLDAQSGKWREPNRGEEFREGQKIRTGEDGIVNLQAENSIRLRLKQNASLSNESCKLQSGKEIYDLALDSGVLFGSTTRQFDRKISEGKADFVIKTPQFNAAPKGALFRIHASGLPNGSTVSALRGFVEVSKSGFLPRNPEFRVSGLEESAVIGGVLQPPAKVTPEAWQDLKEGYELLARSAVMEAEQIDLSKKAGNFFSSVVFDHGAFFTPKIGYAGRDFFVDPVSGEVYLEVEYDVFPTGSFTGIYIKTRDFDASKYEGLTFEARRRGEEGAPDSFFIELKSKGNVLRRFSANGFKQDWTPVESLFRANKPTPINEVVFVFTNERVGESKKGVLEFRNFTLMPKKAPLPVAAAAPAPSASSVPAAPEPAEQPAAEPATRAETSQASSDALVPQTISLR